MIFQEVLNLYFRYKIFTLKNANIIQGFASECAEPASPSDAFKGCQHYKNQYFYFNVEELFFPQTCQINTTKVKTNQLQEHQQ